MVGNGVEGIVYAVVNTIVGGVVDSIFLRLPNLLNPKCIPAQ